MNLDFGSLSYPKKISKVSSSGLHILQTFGHISPHKPMHGCLQDKRLVQGSLQGNLSQGSEHSLVQL